MLEADVAITDYLLTIQCLYFSFYIYKNSLNWPWVLFFASLGLASFVGGTVHGFFPNESSLSYLVLWKTTLILTGVTALSGCYVGSAFLKNEHLANIIKKIALVQFFLFTLVILFYSQNFFLAAVNYLPTTIFMLSMFIRAYYRIKQKSLIFAILGIFFILLGSFIQMSKISFHPEYFTHNALYHALQFIAMYLLFLLSKDKV